MASWLPPGKQTFVDENGTPLDGGFVHHYIPGTSTRKDTWQDYDEVSLNTNPIVLDERGQCMIWGNGSYRQRLTDALGNEIWDRNTTIGPNENILTAGTIFGLTIGNNTGTPNTHLDISIGQARDSTNSVDISLTSPLTKDLSAVWAAGTGNGMRDSATALAASQSYAIYVIQNPTSGAVDVLASQSATNPTLPSGYTNFRRIAFIPRLGGANRPPSGTAIPLFQQWGNQFRLYSANNEYTALSGSTAAQLKDMLLPLGAKVVGMFYAQCTVAAGATVTYRFWDPDQGILPALGGTNQWAQIRLSTAEAYLTVVDNMSTNTLGQIYVEVNDAAAIWAIKSIGWIDYRGIYD